MSQKSPDQTQVWENYWSRENQAQLKDDAMCLFLAIAISEAFRGLTGRAPRSAVEMGAGSGRTSRYLNEAGAETGILDLSPEALKLAAHANQGLKNEVRYFEADLFKVDRKLIGRTYDMVWNAGVLEHFTPVEQRALLGRMASVLSDGGLMMVMCPYANAIFYRLGKFVLEAIGKFPYGREVPLKTLGPVLPDGVELVGRERSIGFLILFFNAFKLFANFPALGGVGRIAHRLVTMSVVALLRFGPTRTALFAVDRILSKGFGGYLLLSVCRVSR